MTPEHWRPVVGFEGRYEVSDLGGVRNCRTGKGLRPGRSANGYLSVALGRKSKLVQHLVAGAFIGPRPPGMLVCHNDGSRTNNRAANLRYDTYAGNSADTERHGTRMRGERYSTAKLTDDSAREIRRLRGIVPQSALAERFGVSPAAVQAVHDGRTWKHV